VGKKRKEWGDCFSGLIKQGQRKNGCTEKKKWVRSSYWAQRRGGKADVGGIYTCLKEITVEHQQIVRVREEGKCNKSLQFKGGEREGEREEERVNKRRSSILQLTIEKQLREQE